MPSFESECKGKRNWRSKSAARKAAKRIGNALEEYLCSHCGRYHVGHYRTPQQGRRQSGRSL